VGIEPPSTGDDYASEDESEEEVEDRPMTREELEEKTVARVRGNSLSLNSYDSFEISPTTGENYASGDDREEEVEDWRASKELDEKAAAA
jgi:hypothetical protein